VLPWKTPRPPRDIDVLAIRKACERFGYCQSSFAGMLGVSARTLQGWEQRRRKPTGPARALLLTIHYNPMAYFDAVAAWNDTSATGTGYTPVDSHRRSVVI
jgi:hypothetical protein